MMKYSFLYISLTLIISIFSAKAAADTTITSVHSGKCVDINASSTQNSAIALQWDCHGGANQEFRLVPSGSFYLIQNVNSGLCLNIQGSSTANGGKVIQWTCGAYTNSQFTFARQSDGSYVAIVRSTGKCLDVPGWSTTNGTQLQQWDCHYGANQRWDLTFSSTATPAPTAAPTPQPPSGSSSYTSISVPGRIQAEYFDNGGQGVAYYDSSYGNNGGITSRGGDVDLESSSDGTPNVGWIADSEWLQYTINVTASGTYNFNFRTASMTSNGLIRVLVDGSIVADNMAVPYTGGWQAWTTVTRSGISLSSGQHRVRIVALRGGFNLNHVDVAAPTSTPVSGTSLRFVSFNLYHGNAGINAQAQLVANQRPDVVSLQEVPDWGYAQFESALESYTGQTWYSRYDYGVMLLTRYPPTSIESRSIGGNSWGSYRSAVRAEINVNGTPVNVFATHLDISQSWDCGYCLVNANNLLSWAAQYGTRKVILGDFNSSPDSGDANQRQVVTNFTNAGYTNMCVEIYGSFNSCPATLDNGWRPDAIYHTSGFGAVSYTVTPTSLSDHNLLFGVLRIQ